MELEGSLLEYEALKSRPFMVYGKPYLDVIYEANEEAAQQKVKSLNRGGKKEHMLIYNRYLLLHLERLKEKLCLANHLRVQEILPTDTTCLIRLSLIVHVTSK